MDSGIGLQTQSHQSLQIGLDVIQILPTYMTFIIIYGMLLRACRHKEACPSKGRQDQDFRCPQGEGSCSAADCNQVMRTSMLRCTHSRHWGVLCCKLQGDASFCSRPLQHSSQGHHCGETTAARYQKLTYEFYLVVVHNGSFNFATTEKIILTKLKVL